MITVAENRPFVVYDCSLAQRATVSSSVMVTFRSRVLMTRI